MFSAADHAFMAQALRLAEQGLYTTTPNPRVGCVIVRQGEVVGAGFHLAAGGPHAEVHALRAAGERAFGATAYVTLEPCAHHGRTPPCADALIAAKVAKLVAAVEDPNPEVSGRGFARLEAAGIEVASGLMRDQAIELNRGFFSRIMRGRPWVRTKLAASLDGKTALNNGISQWITGPEARRDGHRLRAQSCAVLTGIKTVLQDDPQLSVREIETSRQPLRVVVDSSLKIPLAAKILQGPVLIACCEDDPGKRARLEALGAEVLVVPGEARRVDLARLLQLLAGRGVNELLVEAGAVLNGALAARRLIDEMYCYLAPQLLGDAARGMFHLPEISSMENKVEIKIGDVRMVGSDVRITARMGEWDV